MIIYTKTNIERRKMMKKSKIGRSASMILSILLPLLLLVTVILLISYLIEREATPLYANAYYGGMLEYILASLTITVGGAFLAEVAEYDVKKSKS